MNLLKKIVVVGDGACGKTCLLSTFSQNEFPEEYVPTIFETYAKDIELDGQKITLALWDTAGEEDYDRLRPLSYPRTSVVLVCFSIDQPDSLWNVREKWWPEVKHFLPGIPVILVGNKLDLRRKKGRHPVTESEGMKVARKINAARYMECSAKYMVGIKAIFFEAARISLEPIKPVNRWCNYL
ncbi:unnamed protein product [Acanthoscelides obtectus]|uniref:Uncharacterized protein n=1 Tax=Acanthoscelides obtectus TaxID=200917 RepID=A0A9P0L6Q8_ACAOB|nr:unnamed protein product [Acanthoscelides obtectus]CAK1627748.1 Ras-like GTP-binding protein Rho1 [Acanthoscelides obtectus]